MGKSLKPHKSKKVRALQLGARFALPPNSLGYCGRDSAPEKFKNCFINGECEGVEEEFSKFIVLYPYLKTISEVTGLPKYSHKVIESYWLGNDLLKQAENKHYNLLLDNFLQQGVPPWFVDELKSQQPTKFIPLHLFQVLHVGVGRASGAVPFNLESINNCMIRWGKVEEISEDSVIIELNSISRKLGKYELSTMKNSLPFVPEFVPGLKIGDTVAVHWQQVVKKLTDSEAKNLEFWTNEVIKSVTLLPKKKAV